MNEIDTEPLLVEQSRRLRTHSNMDLSVRHWHQTHLPGQRRNVRYLRDERTDATEGELMTHNGNRASRFNRPD